MAKFEIVSKYIDENGNSTVKLPERATACSAGYDLYVAEDTIIPTYKDYIEVLEDYTAKKIPYTYEDMKRVTTMTGIKPVLVPTGVKCKLDTDQYLEISLRSSTPLNTWIVLANSIGIIDSDYYNNPDNEGHIFLQVINFSPVEIILRAGTKIGQGIIKRYETTEDDTATGERSGGFGSTSK